jgi:hypothetical protein
VEERPRRKEVLRRVGRASCGSQVRKGISYLEADFVRMAPLRDLASAAPPPQARYDYDCMFTTSHLRDGAGRSLAAL